MISIKNVTKRFGGIIAVDDSSFDVMSSTICSLIGPNGAGKSTLMKILSGVHQPDAGELEIAGQSVQFHSTRDAENAGVAIIHQELELVEELTVAASNVKIETWSRTPRSATTSAIAGAL